MAAMGAKRFAHAAAVVVGKRAAKLLPDRVPVTYVGAGSMTELCRSIGGQGIDRVLVVTDAVLREIGIVDQVTTALADAGVAAVVHDGITPDPTFTQVEAGHRAFVDHQCDAVLAVGGGSPMDAAKMVAAMATNGGDLAKLEGKLRVRRIPAPLFALPTTAGTGSEVTLAAVVSDDHTHLKKFFLDPKLLPRMCALDPTLMTGIPREVTAATGMDALTHAIESYLSKASNPQTEAYATLAVRLVFEHLPTACNEGGELAARNAMAVASYHGGLAFTRTGVGYVHAIAHNLGALYGTPHGLANALVLPHVLEFSEPEARRQLAELADIVGIGAGTEAARAAAFIGAVRDLSRTVGVPDTLESLRAEDIPTIADLALAEAFLEYPVPRFMEPEDCQSVIARLLPT